MIHFRGLLTLIKPPQPKALNYVWTFFKNLNRLPNLNIFCSFTHLISSHYSSHLLIFTRRSRLPRKFNQFFIVPKSLQQLAMRIIWPQRRRLPWKSLPAALQSLHKISLQSVHNFWSNVAHKQTNKQTNTTKNITYFAKEVINTILSGFYFDTHWRIDMTISFHDYLLSSTGKCSFSNKLYFNQFLWR